MKCAHRNPLSRNHPLLHLLHLLHLHLLHLLHLLRHHRSLNRSLNRSLRRLKHVRTVQLFLREKSVRYLRRTRLVINRDKFMTGR